MKNSEKALLVSLASAGGILAYRALALRSPEQVFSIAELVNPQAVSRLAAQFNQFNNTEFLLDAWDFVGSSISYEGYASDMEFTDHHILCQRCLLPTETLEKGKANCVGKSVLLASLIRNRLPANEVYMVVGDLAKDGIGSHAWVEVARNGGWYILESTTPPGEEPWLRVEDARTLYVPAAYFNDVDLSCLSERFCVSVTGRQCNCLGEG